LAAGDQTARGELILPTITIETWIDAPPEICFDLALNVDAHADSAAFSRERIVAPGRLEGLLELGDTVTFEGKHFGLRQRFTAKIVEVERPRYFVDEMIAGAFKSMRHVHEFRPRDGGTLMRDLLEWQAPLGILGRIADRLFLERHMQWFVRTKQLRLRAIIEQRYALPS